MEYDFRRKATPVLIGLLLLLTSTFAFGQGIVTGSISGVCISCSPRAGSSCTCPSPMRSWCSWCCMSSSSMPFHREPGDAAAGANGCV